MAIDYDFSSLNDKELERLAQDLLNAKYNLGLQSFKTGKDGGVDLRFAGPPGRSGKPEIIVQVKHYLKSGYKVLLRKLKVEELPKVQKLNPRRYIVVTSIALSAKQKDEIRKALSPFVLSSDDVFGRDDLNALLRDPKCEGIEKKWHKLWLSSIESLNVIINYAEENRSEYATETILGKIKLYVETKNFPNAISLLNRNRVLLITGIPGIGKTTLAQLLIYFHLREGFSLIQMNSVYDGEKLLSRDPNKKQIFYFDDFLGSNILQLYRENSSESQIANFIERIHGAKNKRLILTSRTVILNQAYSAFDTIRNTGLRLNEFELKLSDYSDYQKAKILYNHLFWSEVPENLRNAIVQKRFYMRIIKHKNYSPRLIEFFTKATQISGLSAEEYVKFIVNSLNHPSEIWSHSFHKQIDIAERCFLMTLLTKGRSPVANDVIDAFQTRLQYEKTHHGLTISTDLVDQCIKVLMGGFISSEVKRKNRYSPKFEQIEIQTFDFVNPSLGDFLISLLKNRKPELIACIKSAVSIDQMAQIASFFRKKKFTQDVQKVFLNHLMSQPFQFESAVDKTQSAIEILAKKMELISIHCQSTDASEFLIYCFNELKDIDPDKYKINIQDIHINNFGYPAFHSFLDQKFEDYIDWVLEHLDDQGDIEWFPQVFEDFEKDYSEFTDIETNIERLHERILLLLSDQEYELEADEGGSITSKEQVKKLYEVLESDGWAMSQAVGLGYDIMDYFIPDYSEHHWASKIEENTKDMEEQEYNAEIMAEDFRFERLERQDEERMIDDLFSKT